MMSAHTAMVNRMSPHTPMVHTMSPHTPMVHTMSPHTPMVHTMSPHTPMVHTVISYTHGTHYVISYTHCAHDLTFTLKAYGWVGVRMSSAEVEYVIQLPCGRILQQHSVISPKCSLCTAQIMFTDVFIVYNTDNVH